MSDKKSGGPVATIEREVPAPAGFMVEAQARGEVEIQMAIARKFPRSLAQFKTRLQEMVTLDRETADTMNYALPRGGKLIEGPSVRFAECAAACWGHLRINARPIEETHRAVIALGAAWDLETNVLVAIEVERRVTERGGGKFNDDMLSVATNAASSIAIRNAILKVIPASLWKPAYQAARLVAVGDLKTIGTLRAQAIEGWGKVGIQPEQIFALLGIGGVDDMTGEHLAGLRALYRQVVLEKEIALEDAFPSMQSTAVGERAHLDRLREENPKLAAMIESGFARLEFTPAKRMQKLVEYTGKPEALAAWLENQIGQPLSELEAADVIEARTKKATAAAHAAAAEEQAAKAAAKTAPVAETKPAASEPAPAPAETIPPASDTTPRDPEPAPTAPTRKPTLAERTRAAYKGGGSL